MRAPPAPMLDVITPVLVRVPLVTVSVALKPRFALVRSIVPAFVNPVAIVRLAVLDTLCPSTRSVPLAGLVNVLLNAPVPANTSVPWLSNVTLIVLLVTAIVWPFAFVSEPVPTTAVPESVSASAAVFTFTPSVSVDVAIESEATATPEFRVAESELRASAPLPFIAAPDCCVNEPPEIDTVRPDPTVIVPALMKDGDVPDCVTVRFAALASITPEFEWAALAPFIVSAAWSVTVP